MTRRMLMIWLNCRTEIEPPIAATVDSNHALSCVARHAGLVLLPRRDDIDTCRLGERSAIGL